jgi:hypothetical protein
LFVYDRRLFLADATLPFGPIQVSFQRWYFFHSDCKCVVGIRFRQACCLHW